MRQGRSPSEVKVQTIVCNTGLDESASGKAGALYNIENMRVSPAGGTLRKRAGYTGIIPSMLAAYFWPLVTGGGVKAVALATDGRNRIACCDNGVAYSINGVRVSEAGFISACEPLGYDASLVSEKCYGQQMPQCAETPLGFVALANATCVTVLSPSGAVLFSGVAQDGATPADRVFVGAIGETFVLFVKTLNALTMRLLPAPYTGISEPGSAVALTLDVSRPWWDAVCDGVKVFVVYQTSAISVRLDSYTVSGSLSDRYDYDVTSGTYALSVSLVGIQQWLGFYHVTSRVASFAVYDTGSGYMLLEQTTMVSPDADGVRAPSGPPLFGSAHDDSYAPPNAVSLQAFAVIRATGIMAGSRGMYALYAGVDGTLGAAAFVQGALPISKPDATQRVWVIPGLARSADPLVYRFSLVRFRGSTTVVYPEPGIVLSTEWFLWNAAAFDPELRLDAFQSVTTTATTSHVGIIRPISDSTSVTTLEAKAIRYRTPQQGAKSSVTVLESVIASGQPVQLCVSPPDVGYPSGPECGWLSSPGLLGITFIPSLLGSSLVAGTYGVRAVWEYVDSKGNRHLSRPSEPTSFSVGSAGGGIRSFWTRASSTHRPGSRVSVRGYRTLGAGGIQSQQYYSFGASMPSTAAETYCQLTDTTADSDVRDEETIYTDGGVKPNDAAPACRYVVASENRLWCGGLLHDAQLQASRVFYPGEPVNFVDDNAWRVALPARCTGLAHMDGTVVAFTASAIYLVTGKGPDDRGVGSFDEPQKHSDIGCLEVDSQSIVTTNAGVLFRSPSGFFLLPRGFGPLQSVGDKIADSLASHVILSGAYADTPQGSEARFVVAPSYTASTGMHEILAFDLGSGQWYRDTLPHNAGVIGVWPDGFVHSPATLMASGPHYYYQQNGGVSDDGHFIPAKIQTAWQHPFGVGGHGRVGRLLLATEGSPVRIRATIETDEGHTQVATLDFASDREPYNYREIMLEHPALGAYRLTLEEQAFSGANLAFGAVAITAECDDSDALRPSDEGERA